MVFFVVLEILADEFNIHNPGICRISVKKLRKNCQISGKKLAKILHFFNEKAQKNPEMGISFYVEFNDAHILISCPKFKRLCDEYTRKKLKTLKLNNPDTIRTDANKLGTLDRDRDRDRVKNLTGSPKKTGGSGLLFDKNNMGPMLELIINRCEKIELLKTETPKEINIYEWVQRQINSNGHPSAIIEALDMLVERWPGVLSPWAYTTAIFELKNGNYWETEHIKESKKFREHWGSNRKILDLIKNIGSENQDDDQVVF